MSCYSCGETFGVFKKERGCKNCGYAFCSRCLPRTIKVPKLDNKTHHVCNKCYNILTGKTKPEDTTGRYSPPEAFKKRVAALENKSSAVGGATGLGTSKVKSEHRGLSKSDCEIAERLEKLREKPQSQEKVTDQDIHTRLARLKGREPSAWDTEKKRFYQPPDRRSQQEEVNDLLDEIANEVDLDSHLPDPTSEIEARLAQLKGQGQNQLKGTADSLENNLNKSTSPEVKPYLKNIAYGTSGGGNSKNVEEEKSLDEVYTLLQQSEQELKLDANRAMKDLNKDKELMKQLQDIKKKRKNENVNKDLSGARTKEAASDSDNENEEELADRIVQQLTEESKLDEAMGQDGPETLSDQVTRVKKPSNEEYVDDDELPYCCMCTEDATTRCHGCDMDLYCTRCWRESHKECEMEDHRSSKYTAPIEKT
ncbi:hypothetical protein ScPMuIL_013875 [Solemya velum]